MTVWRRASWRHGFIALAMVVAAGASPPGKVIYSDDFRGPLENWVAELEKPGRIQSGSGFLEIDVPAGCTLWFKPELTGPIRIEYDVLMVSDGGANDRVSDLNAFWMATDTRSPEDFFKTKHTGAFADYNQLKTYYVGQGGNSNTTTRFRRYIGSASERPLLPEHDLRTRDMLLRPNVWQRIQLVADERHIQYQRDGKIIFDFTDSDPYTRGRFAFRTTFSHIRLKNFRVYGVGHFSDPRRSPRLMRVESSGNEGYRPPTPYSTTQR